MIDYNKASVTYDNTRSADDIILNEFNLKVNLTASKILDFGCGTGNYIKLIFIIIRPAALSHQME